MKPYIISSPDFNVTSGGIRVMWGLYGWLLAKGQVAYMNRYPEVDRIAIYPEIFHGNPIGAKTVVRYILNEPGVMGAYDQDGQFKPGPTTFDSTDRLYVFSKIFNTVKANEDHLLFLPILNTHEFYNQKKNRPHTCFLVGKGENQHKHPTDSIELSRQFASDQGQLAEFLNECHTLYCYDKLTAMTEVARLCGCKVKYYGGYTKDEMSLYEPGMNGISMGEEDMPLDCDAFRTHYIALQGVFSHKLDRFIEDTQKG